MTYQCGQRNVASDVVNGAISSAERLGVVRRVRTGVVLDACCFGADVGADAEVGCG